MDERACSIAAVRSLGGDAVAIDVESPADFSAQPGQFVKLTFDVENLDGETEDGESEEVSRFYTISSPDVDGTFELTIEIDPEGELGPHLADLEAGDELVVSGPFGRDYYEGEPRVVVVAGGPGVGPAVGIVERAIADGGAAAVVYRDDDPIFEDRLAALRDDGALVSVLAAGESLDEAVADAVAAGEVEPQLFVYGFAGFIDDATSAIERAGADADGAKIENFG